MESKNIVQEIRYDDSNYLKDLKKSITEGKVVVLINIREKLDPELGNSKHIRITKTCYLLILIRVFLTL